MTQRSFTISIEIKDDTRTDSSTDGIIYDYSNEFRELFQDCNFNHNITINHLNDNIYLISYPENDIPYMYKYLCDNDILSNDEMSKTLNILFANPVDIDWWYVFGLKAEILSTNVL
jgi:hypothetical protein